ncbi:MAG: acetyl-CoA C-acetyltransferase [Burkholderiales bacterium]|jgi:acetyl-CoA C-acetyltransferase
MAEAYIVAVGRTAGARRGGRLSNWHPVDLGAEVINALIDRSKCDPAIIDDVIFGCVGQIGEQAMNVARNAVLASKLPLSVPGTSLDRQCGSSQQALHFAAQAVLSGTMDAVIAGGVESMTRVPMGATSELPKKNGMGFYMSEEIQNRFGSAPFSQFTGAEMLVKKYDLSKDTLDQFALRSHRLAVSATEAGLFQDEIVPLRMKTATGETTDEIHNIDEGIRFDATLEGIAGVKQIMEGGKLTAATASQICDGASGVLVVNEVGLKKIGIEPIARIHHMSVLGHDPVIMLEAPIPATERAYQKSGLKQDDIDLFEVNEAFASVPLSWLKVTGADIDKLNVHGGAIALGHPLGSSGTKLATTLVSALRAKNKRYGLQTMCEGGGMANVTIFENLQRH